MLSDACRGAAGKRSRRHRNRSCPGTVEPATTRRDCQATGLSIMTLQGIEKRKTEARTPLMGHRMHENNADQKITVPHLVKFLQAEQGENETSIRSDAMGSSLRRGM